MSGITGAGAAGMSNPVAGDNTNSRTSGFHSSLSHGDKISPPIKNSGVASQNLERLPSKLSNHPI